MNETRLTTVAGRYYALRGLLLLPAGVLVIAAGLFNMPPIGAEPVSGEAGYFFAAVVVAALGYLVLNHYYLTRFGRVDPATGTKVRVGVAGALQAVALTVGITIDMQLDLPVSTLGALFAITTLGQYRLLVGLRAYHWWLLGGLGLLSLLPIWGDVGDKVSLVMVPIGLAVIGLGLFDHRDLVESIRKARSTSASH